MSRETVSWLNSYVLVGDTANRGKGWHYLESEQGERPNHYEGSIPVEDIRERLFGWVPETYPLSVTLPDGTIVSEPNKQVIVRPAFNGLPAAIMGVPSDSYDHHNGYGPLLDNAQNILDTDELVILSAGLLKNGGVGWIQVGLNGGVSVASGDKVIPFITFSNSLNGTVANRVDTGVVRVVCDNTLSAFLSSASATYKVKHTKYSRMRIADARDALGLIQTTTDAFTAEVNSLLDIAVNNERFEQIVDHIVPLIPADVSKAGATRSEKKRDALWGIWNKGEMVAPLENTAYKAWQAFNTMETHFSQVRGVDRGQKNFTNMVTGNFVKDDQDIVVKIRKALSLAA